jgi:hypothetical protein
MTDDFEDARRLAEEMAAEVDGQEFDDDSDDDEEPSRAEAFEVMTPTQFNAHRLEAWEMAYVALTKQNGKEREWGDYEIDAADVLLLARFLEGDELSE